MPDQYTLTNDELKAVVSEAVKETLTTMGVDTTNPIEMQKDFSHLREWRLSVDMMKNKAMVGSLLTVLAGGIAALWIGIKVLLTQP